MRTVAGIGDACFRHTASAFSQRIETRIDTGGVGVLLAAHQ